MVRSEHQYRVMEFMEKAGQHSPPRPCIPSAEVRVLRAKLILEEALELIRGLGIAVTIMDDRGNLCLTSLNAGAFFEAVGKPDLVEIADGFADLSVVNVGTAIACGLSDIPLLELVDYNNLQKFGPGGHRNADGKWIKPADHNAPDFAAAIKEMLES